VPGQLTARSHLDAIEQVRVASRKHGKACGLLASDGDAAAEKVSKGWSFVTVGPDSTLLAGAATAQLMQARRQQSPP
jgi:4-hydroxy-2-oxoheptanedioate aldolase